jgi:ATP-dependent Clp protease protease subunit
MGREVCSAATLLLAAGSKRYLMPHAQVMIHLPSGGFEGNAEQIDSQNKEMKKFKEEMVAILIECGVKKSREAILKDMRKELWMTAKEAIEYGLADKIATKEDVAGWFK